MRTRVCLLVDQVTLDAGTERQVAETVRRMDHSRFEVHLCCFEDSPRYRELAKLCKAELFPLESVYTAQGVRQTWRFHQYLVRNRIEIVQAFMMKTSVFGVLAGLGWDGVMITSRLNTGYWYTPAKLSLFRFLNRYTDRIIANSEGAKRIAIEAEKLDTAKVDVVYQGVDMEVFSLARANPRACDALGIPASARVVGLVANLRPVKDPALFLRSAGLVAQKIPDAAFLLAGKGELKPELERLAGELGIQDRVFFTNGEGRVVDYLARMSVGCLTSLSEGFSNAILEYMAMGLPAVATDVGGNGEAIIDGNTGFLVRDRRPETIAELVIRLLEDEALRRSMGERAKARCTSEFEINRTIRKLEDYYLAVVGKNQTDVRIRVPA